MNNTKTTIRITRGLSGVAFPYGFMSSENRKFVEDNVGNTFDAVRCNINFYMLDNGMTVHIYNATEVKQAENAAA